MRSAAMPVLRPGGLLPSAGAASRKRGTAQSPWMDSGSSETVPRCCACGGEKAQPSTLHSITHVHGYSCSGPKAVRRGSAPPDTLPATACAVEKTRAGQLNLERTDDLTQPAGRREKINAAKNLTRTAVGGDARRYTAASRPAQAPVGAPSLRYGPPGAPAAPPCPRIGVAAARTLKPRQKQR